MPKRRLIDELDDAVNVMMRSADSPLPHVDPELVEMLQIAADLRDLPTETFKGRLGAQLLDAAKGTSGRTETDVAGPQLIAHDIAAALIDLGELEVVPGTTEAEAFAAVWELAAFNQCMLGLTRFSGRSPWERHPDGDEFLHVLEGDVDFTILTDERPVQLTVSAGSVFVCPRGLWHRQYSKSGATLLFATPPKGSEISWADDPRSEA
jgi:uncharacterized cupin superfamily protein